MKKKYFIFLLFLVVLCLLGIGSINCIRTYALTNVPTNSYIGEMEILPFYSEDNEYINYGLAYNSTNQTNYFIATYVNKNQGFPYPNNAYYFWMYNFDLINTGGSDEPNPPIEEVQQFTLSLDGVIQATFDFVVGQTWQEWYVTSLNINNVITYDSTEGAFYFDTDFIILNITSTNLILNQDYEIVDVSIPSMTFIVSSDTFGDFTFNLPTDNISFKTLIKNYGVPGWDGYTFYYDVNNTAYLYCSNVALNSSTEYRGLFFDDGTGGGLTFDTANLNTLITNNSVFNLSAASGGGGANDPGNEFWRPDEGPSASSYVSIDRLDLSNVFSNDELISYFKTCINWDWSILRRVITGVADLYLNYNGLWFKCNYNPYATSDSEMYLNIVYNPTLPSSTTDNYTYGLGEITPYVLNAYNNYELRTNIQEELKVQQSYYESLLEQQKNQAFQDGYNNGESYGYNTGYNGGYNVGYAEGLEQGSDGEFTLRSLLGTIFTFPLQILTVGMDVEIFGINLGGLIMFLFALSIVVIIIRLVFKFFGR